MHAPAQPRRAVAEQVDQVERLGGRSRFGLHAKQDERGYGGNRLGAICPLAMSVLRDKVHDNSKIKRLARFPKAGTAQVNNILRRDSDAWFDARLALALSSDYRARGEVSRPPGSRHPRLEYLAPPRMLVRHHGHRRDLPYRQSPAFSRPDLLDHQPRRGSRGA